MTIQIHITNQGHRHTNPAIVAAWVLDRQGERCMVSDPGVVSAVLAQAKERGVKRVLGGGKP